MEDEKPRQWRPFGWLLRGPRGRLEHFLWGVAAAIVAAVVIAVASSSGGGKTGGGGGTGKKVHTTSPRAPTQKSSSPATPVHYLKSMKPIEGDRPVPGEVQLAGRPYGDSIFYENPASAASTTNWCENEPSPCRSTSYALGGKYQTFTATFGVQTQPNAYPSEWHWMVVADGEVVKQGFVPDDTPEPIHVPVGGKHLLELRASARNLNTEEVTFVWGKAGLSG